MFAQMTQICAYTHAPAIPHQCIHNCQTYHLPHSNTRRSVVRLNIRLSFFVCTQHALLQHPTDAPTTLKVVTARLTHCLILRLNKGLSFFVCTQHALLQHPTDAPTTAKSVITRPPVAPHTQRQQVRVQRKGLLLILCIMFLIGH